MVPQSSQQALGILKAQRLADLSGLNTFAPPPDDHRVADHARAHMANAWRPNRHTRSFDLVVDQRKQCLLAQAVMLGGAEQIRAWFAQRIAAGQPVLQGGPSLTSGGNLAALRTPRPIDLEKKLARFLGVLSDVLELERAQLARGQATFQQKVNDGRIPGIDR